MARLGTVYDRSHCMYSLLSGRISLAIPSKTTSLSVPCETVCMVSMTSRLCTVASNTGESQPSPLSQSDEAPGLHKR